MLAAMIRAGKSSGCLPVVYSSLSNSKGLGGTLLSRWHNNADLHSSPDRSDPNLLTDLDRDTRALIVKNLLVDTLSLFKGFERVGISRDQAEELSHQITALIVLNKEKMDQTFVKQQTLDRITLEQEASIVGFKTELSKSQDMHIANVNKDLERQQSFLDKTRAEVKHEIDKLTSSQRLDLNLEKGRMRDDLQTIRDKVTELEIKVDHDINDLKSSVEKAKNDTIKSVITILGTFSAIAFTISRFVQMSNGHG